MEYTSEEIFIVLHRLLEELKSNKQIPGLCTLLNRLVMDRQLPRNYEVEDFISSINEETFLICTLKIKPPKGYQSRIWWFPRFDKISRIELIEKTIERLKNEQQKTA